MSIRGSGLLLYPPIRIEDEFVKLSTQECRERVRSAILYFDRVAPVSLSTPPNALLPTVNFSSEELQLLVIQEVVTPIPMRSVSYGNIGTDYLSDDLEFVFRWANENGNIPWSLGIPIDIRISSGDYAHNSLKIDLLGILPSPSTDIPIPDIIDFRISHETELRNLHWAIDRAFSSSGVDFELAAREISESANIIEERLRKRKFPFLKIDLSISKAIEAGAVVPLSGAFADYIGLPVLLGSALGGLITISSQNSKISNIGNKMPKDYEYIFRGRSSNILSDGRDIGNVRFNFVGSYHQNSSVMSGFLQEIVEEADLDFSSVTLHRNILV